MSDPDVQLAWTAMPYRAPVTDRDGNRIGTAESLLGDEESLNAALIAADAEPMAAAPMAPAKALATTAEISRFDMLVLLARSCMNLLPRGDAGSGRFFSRFAAAPAEVTAAWTTTVHESV